MIFFPSFHNKNGEDFLEQIDHNCALQTLLKPSLMFQCNLTALFRLEQFTEVIKFGLIIL